MNFKHIFIVFKKEVKDIIRDKKTIITTLLAPMIIMPVLLMLMGGGVEKLTKDINENVTIALAQDSNTPEIRSLVETKIISENKNIKLVDINNPIVDSIRQEKVRAVLEFEKDYAVKLNAGKPFNIKIMYDKSKTKSEGSLQIIKDAITAFNLETVKQRMIDKGLDPSILTPAQIVENDVADKKQAGNAMLMMIMPMLLGILVAVGGIPAATDLVAGEKERNTFEPLLTTKPSRLSLLMGKYLTVTLFSLVSVLSTVTGMVLGYIGNPNAINGGMAGQTGGFYMDPGALVITIVTTLLLGMTFAGIQITLSTYAKSFKEAQTYLSLLIFVAMIPAYATMFMQPADIQSYMFLVPVLNTISAFKMVLGGMINYTYLIMALLSSILYMFGSIVLAAWMFTKEKVLFRS